MKYKLFGNSGLRVSELCLGTMTFGTEWGMGADYDGSKQIFNAFAEAGGNFIDTANRYTEGSSERFLADFLERDRDHFVLATKYTLYDKRNDPNYGGNHRKNLMRSVRESLKRLHTDHLDLLWLHAWDFTTPIEEVMRGLEDLVRSGDVHYIGISDTPAWVISRANMLAELRGWAAFAAIQIEYSLLERTPERELIPMAESLGLAITPWGAIGGGALTGKYLQNNDDPKRLQPQSKRLNPQSQRVAAEVVDIANGLGVAPAQVALNWVRQRSARIIPIIGARNAEQLQSNLACLDFQLSAGELQRLDAVSAIELGFPHEFLRSDSVREVIFGGTYKDIAR